jgi:hypothetical protein
MTDITNVIPPKPCKDKDGHIYKSQAEKMRYYMRRLRGSTLPHYPEFEEKKEQAA